MSHSEPAKSSGSVSEPSSGPEGEASSTSSSDGIPSAVIVTYVSEQGHIITEHVALTVFQGNELHGSPSFGDVTVFISNGVPSAFYANPNITVLSEDYIY